MPRLTPREQQIVRLLGLGWTGEHIAGSLGIALLTVRKHRANIATKLGLQNTARIAAHCVKSVYSVEPFPFCHNDHENPVKGVNVDSRGDLKRQESIPHPPFLLQPAATLAALRPREREILRLLSQGLTSKEIAKGLDISPRTVSKHRENIMRKLHIHNVVGLMHIDKHIEL